tara:strand:+ start:147 stop:959 length:813 start_codon:yes stop_codon:yes gene_type:complete
MILLLGQHSDPVLRHFGRFLKRGDRSFVFINVDHIGREILLNRDCLSLKGEIVSEHSIQGVFNRWFAMPTDLTSSHRYLLHCLNYRWPNVINKPIANQSNTSKLFQIEFMRQMGLSIPDSVVVCGPHPSLKGDWIYKSISGVRSIVERVSHCAQSVVREPVLFQKFIDGLNIRVHVTSVAVSAIGMASDAVDYRYSQDVNPLVIQLPKLIIDQCQSVRQALGLRFCGIDLIVKDRTYYFLEVNPMPAYSYFEDFSKHQTVSKALYEEIIQ